MKVSARLFLVVSLLVALLGCDKKNGEKLNEADTVMHCIGRHSVELPMGFSQVNGSISTFTPANDNKLEAEIETQIVATGVTKKDFEQRVSQRKEELSRAGDASTNILKLANFLPENTVMFRVLSINDAYWSEFDVLLNDVYLRVRAESYENSYKAVEATMRRFIAGLTPVAAKTSHGFCIGPLMVGGRNLSEMSTLAFRNVNRPDVLIKFSIDTFSEDEEPLLARMDGPNSLLRAFSVDHRVLRKGKLKVAGMDAEEWLGAAQLGVDGQTQYNFALETRRHDPAPDRPSMHIEFKTGQYDAKGILQSNSFTDEEATKTWDALVKSIRLRK